MTEIKIHRPQIQMSKQEEIKKPLNPVDSKKYIPSEVKDFAAAMESQFTELMLKEMQKSSAPSDRSQSEEFYDGLLTTERAKSMTEQSNRGLKDLILDQVYPEYKRTAQNYALYEQHKQQFNKQKIQMHEGPTKLNINMHESAKPE